VLYLAEVKKQTSKFMGGLRTELKLIAFQRNDQSWNRVSTEEIVASEEIPNPIGEGALLIVQVEGGQIQGKPELATNRLVRLLQDFSRLLEKSKEDEETIEQWRQSLTYQGEELSRQRLEMDALLEQVAEKEEEFKLLEQRRLEIEQSWSQLQVRQTKLDESKIDAEKAHRIVELIGNLRSTLGVEEQLRQQIGLAFESVDGEQAILQNHWGQFEQQKNLLEQKKREVEQRGGELKNRKEELARTLASLEQARIDLQLQRQSLEHKKEISRIQEENLGVMKEVWSGLHDLGGDSDILENMPLGELEELVANTKTDLDKTVGFVNDQEEELTLRSERVKELEEQISRADVIERLTLESELAEEQEAVKFLDKALQGQRETLRKKRNIFFKYLQVLRRRQGVSSPQTNEPEVDLNPILVQLDKQKDNLEKEKQRLDTEIEQMQMGLESLTQAVNQYIDTQESKDQEIQEMEMGWQDAKLELKQVQWLIEFYQSNLQPIQDYLDSIRQKLQQLEQSVNQVGQNREQRNQCLSEMEQMLS
jgi:chromosome segregation ATPase